MSRAAADLVDAAAVGLQLRLDNIEQVEPVLVDRHDLWRGKGSRARDGDVGVHGLAAHILIKAVRRVLIGRTAGVGVQRRQMQLELILEPEKAEELLRALAETAAVGRDARGHVLERLILRRPGRVVGKHVPQIPGIFLRDLLAFRDPVLCHLHDASLHFSNYILYHAFFSNTINYLK